MYEHFHIYTSNYQMFIIYQNNTYFEELFRHVISDMALCKILEDRDDIS